MTYFLGVDGGGTGCRVVLADAQGRVLARAEGGSANIAHDLEKSLQNILLASRTALAEVVGPATVDANLPQIRAGLGLAGANVAGRAEALVAHLPFARARVVNDAVTTVKGALGANDGIVAAMGTGSVFAIQLAGVIRQIGGWGFWLGDEGSGAVLGQRLLARCLRALDGVVPMTPLLAAVLDGFGSADRMVQFSLTARPADYAAHAPKLVGSADPAAVAIMDRAVDEVMATIAALQPQLALPVTYLGGLGPFYAARITTWPQKPAKGSALDGALLLAQEVG